MKPLEIIKLTKGQNENFIYELLSINSTNVYDYATS